MPMTKPMNIENIIARDFYVSLRVELTELLAERGAELFLTDVQDIMHKAQLKADNRDKFSREDFIKFSKEQIKSILR